MHALRPLDVSWGSALLEQNADVTVRCDVCDQAGFVPSTGRDPLLDRLQWPLVRCVFQTSCRGHMRREWLN